MNRRQFLQSSAAALVLERSSRTFAGAMPASPSTVPTAGLTRFEHMPLGVSFHFSMNTFTGNDYDEGTAPATLYAPSALNVDQWISTAALIGARYAILTAKHMSGFCLWDADNYDYDVAASGNHEDVCTAFVAACKKRDIMPGFYYCILDPRNEHNQGHVDWTGPVSSSYYDLILRQLTQLQTKYKGVGLQLIDIPAKLTQAQRWEVYRTVKSANPNCLMMVNQTWQISQDNRGRISDPGSWPTDIILSEDALPPAEGHDSWVLYEGKRYYMPMASWIPTGPFYKNMKYRCWFWNQQFKTRPAVELFDIYQKTVKGKASLMLNFSPDTRGLIPDEAVEQLQGLAKLMGRSH